MLKLVQRCQRLPLDPFGNIPQERLSRETIPIDRNLLESLCLYRRNHEHSLFAKLCLLIISAGLPLNALESELNVECLSKNALFKRLILQILISMAPLIAFERSKRLASERLSILRISRLLVLLID